MCYMLICLLAAVLLTGCSQKEEDERLTILKYESGILGKEMITQVYLPEGYDENTAYPALYFFPAGSGSSYTVMNQLGMREAYDSLIEAGEIRPMILVAPGIDLSFGMNSAEETAEVKTEYDITFDMGRYEDYFLQEVIPMIEEGYAVSNRREDRFIGGYSMGGLAALHVSMRNPELFSKAGGHSPTLFLEDETDLSNQTFLMVRNYFYSTEELHQERNPIYLAESADLSGLSIFIDTGPEDVNARAVVVLHEILAARDANVQMELYPGSHSYGYCSMYMEEYLRFYAGVEER